MAGSGERRMDTAHWPDVEQERRVTSASSPVSEAMPDSASAESGARKRGAPRQRLDRLSRAVEADVIPRLVMARRSSKRPRSTGPHSNVCSPADVVELARLVLVADESLATQFVAALNARGLSMEAIYIELFGDTARHLGELWTEDHISFTHVTTGVWRLQQMLHEFRGPFLAETPRRDTGLRILLTPAIGSQHSLGMAMVGEFFRRDGWSVHTALITSITDLSDIVRAEWFDAIGFSLGDSNRVDELRATIAAGRRASRNLQIGVMVGGPVFASQPDHAQSVGADVLAMDGRDAARLLEETLNLVARP